MWSKANENIELGVHDVGAWLVYGTCEAQATESAKFMKEHSLVFSVVRKRSVERYWKKFVIKLMANR